MRALLIRHYKTLINASNEIMGWGNSPPADDWEPDLQYVNQQLQQLGLRFDAVYSSHLERSLQTARYFAQLRNIDEVRDQTAFNEVNYGALYKKSKHWVEKHIPEYKTDPDFVFPGGESFRQMQNRSVALFTSLANRHADQQILIVAHAGVVRALVSHFLGLDYSASLKHKISHRYIGDFQFRGESCYQYDELGKPSGFIRNGIIQVPYQCEKVAPGKIPERQAETDRSSHPAVTDQP